MSDLLERLTSRLREAIHGECYEVIADQHDAVVAGAAAHHQAETELAQVRAELAEARRENALLRGRIDAALALSGEPLELPFVAEEGADPVQAALSHHYGIWFALIELGWRVGRDLQDEETRERAHLMADAHRKRLNALTEALAGPERAAELVAALERLAAEPITVPEPRAADPATV